MEMASGRVYLRESEGSLPISDDFEELRNVAMEDVHRQGVTSL
jgi:hypothetical protein